MCTMEKNVAISVDLENDETIWVKNLKKKMDDTLLTVSPAKQATIFRVPDIIKNTDPEAYEPKCVSLGPYHHDEQRLREWGDEHKCHCLKKFLSRNPNKCLQYYLNLVKGLEDKARIAYSEEPNMSSNDFVQMMLLDCCFVIEILLLINEEDVKEEEMQKEKESRIIRYDFLKKAIKRVIPKKKMQAICNFVKKEIKRVIWKKKQATEEEKKKQATKEKEEDPILRTSQWALPLLAQATKEKEEEEEEDPILRTWKWVLPLVAHDVLMLENQLPLFVLESLLLQIDDQYISMDQLMLSFFRNFHLGSSIREVSKDSMKQCHHLLHLFHSCIIPKLEDRGDGGHRIAIADQPPPPVPCARDLREARVKLVRKKAKAEEAVSFLDITFKRGNIIFTGGRMEIPQLRIDDDTNSLLRNLIAFEQCYPDAGLHVTTYAWFMDSLIDTGIDVALLRQRDIIDSWLGSDKEVALLFNKLCKEVVIDRQRSYLSGVLVDVKKHCDKKYNKCCASLKHDYFSNPWVFISVIAAVLLFLLTITQTVFSVLSYVGQ